MTKIFFTLPFLSAVISFMVFIASMISKTCPILTLCPSSINFLALGSGERYAVPTIGDFKAFSVRLTTFLITC